MSANRMARVALGALLPIVSVGISSVASADYSKPAVTGIFDPASGDFRGVVRQVGCRTDEPFSISGNVKDGRISGSDNVAAFDMQIESDGTFGPQKAFLRKHSSRDDKYRWISGRLKGEKLFIDVEYGSPGHGGSYCGSNGNTFEAGAECPLCGIDAIENSDSAAGLKVNTAAQNLIDEWGEYAATEASMKAIYSEEAEDNQSRLFWLEVRKRIEDLKN